MTQRSALQQIEKLEEAGLIKRKKRVNPDNPAQNLSNLYTLCFLDDDPPGQVIHRGSESDSGGVVNDIQGGSESDAGGVVNEVHTNKEIKKETTTTQEAAREGSSPAAGGGGDLFEFLNFLIAHGVDKFTGAAMAKAASKASQEQILWLKDLVEEGKHLEKDNPTGYLISLAHRAGAGELTPTATSVARARAAQEAQEAITQAKAQTLAQEARVAQEAARRHGELEKRLEHFQPNHKNDEVFAKLEKATFSKLCQVDISKSEISIFKDVLKVKYTTLFSKQNRFEEELKHIFGTSKIEFEKVEFVTDSISLRKDFEEMQKMKASK